MSTPPRHPVTSVGNALEIILALRDRRSMRVADAARMLDVAPSTAHRLLRMLDQYGFVEQDPDSREYRAGSALLGVGLSAIRDLDIRQLARPVMEELCEAINETTNLLVLHGSRVLFVDGIEPARAVRVGQRTGVSLPAHVTSGGKAILAYLPRERFYELYPSTRLEGVTPRSIQSRKALERELDQIRVQGYATNIGESEADVCAMAAPIIDSSGYPRGAIGISMPESRWDETHVERHLRLELMSAARSISSQSD